MISLSLLTLVSGKMSATVAPEQEEQKSPSSDLEQHTTCLLTRELLVSGMSTINKIQLLKQETKLTVCFIVCFSARICVIDCPWLCLFLYAHTIKSPAAQSAHVCGNVSRDVQKMPASWCWVAGIGLGRLCVQQAGRWGKGCWLVS